VHAVSAIPAPATPQTKQRSLATAAHLFDGRLLGASGRKLLKTAARQKHTTQAPKLAKSKGKKQGKGKSDCNIPLESSLAPPVPIQNCYIPLQWRNHTGFASNSKGEWVYWPSVAISGLPGHGPHCRCFRWSSYMDSLEKINSDVLNAELAMDERPRKKRRPLLRSPEPLFRRIQYPEF
jgi:hypothetical protein